MACSKCNTDNYDPCTSCQQEEKCACPVRDLSFDCLLWSGDSLACSGIEPNITGTQLIIQLDQFICDTFAQVDNFITLINIGGGAEIFAGINMIGNRELRTLTSGNLNLVDIIQNPETIDILPGTHRLQLDSPSDILSLIVNTMAGDTTLSNIDLSEYNYDTFVQSASFDNGTQILTIVRNNGEPDIDVDLTFLENHLESVVYNDVTDQLEFTLTDTTVLTVDMSVVIADVQIQSDYLENSTSSPAHILNRNPSRTETIGGGGTYNVVDADNNYIIEIDNGANNVTIDLSSITATSEFFVGFIQAGTGDVTFTGYDILPSTLTDVLFGQGHVCAVEIIGSTIYLIGTLRPI